MSTATNKTAVRESVSSSSVCTSLICDWATWFNIIWILKCGIQTIKLYSFHCTLTHNTVTITVDFKSPFHRAISIQQEDWSMTGVRQQEFLMRTLLISEWTYFVENKPSEPNSFGQDAIWVKHSILFPCSCISPHILLSTLVSEKAFHHQEICMNIFTFAGHFCNPSIRSYRDEWFVQGKCFIHVWKWPRWNLK